MGKDKLKRWAEMRSFDHVVEPTVEEVFRKDYKLKGKWHSDFFKNDKPIVLELGCGRGEYSVGLGRKYPKKNIIGIDIKGARLWRGAKTALEENLENVAFIRTRIEFIESFFAEGEVSEVWITFPDPQAKTRRTKKRLTSSRFLNDYKNFLTQDGVIHLKTDSKMLHDYTNEVIKLNNLEVLVATDDLYNSHAADDILSIKTAYEMQYLEKGTNITYLKFRLTNTDPIEEPPTEDEQQ